MSYIVVDVESDGPYPDQVTGYSMICFGAVVVEPSLSKTFYGKVSPISGIYDMQTLAISGFTREEHCLFDSPYVVMKDFTRWIEENSKGRPIFISDNLAYDWQFMNYYFHRFTYNNPFGYSGRRIGDLWCGFNNDMFLKWKWMRVTKHTHNPVDDAMGNAEAILKMKEKGLNIKLL